MELILKYFPNLSKKQQEQFAKLYDLYIEWNAKINVISRKDIDELYLRHVLHSLAIAKVVRFNSGTEILDVGTGGGFPGIPLAIMFPECQFHLVDSINKKLKVIEAVKESLGLSNVTTTHTRAENLNHKYDFIVSRAVTRMSEFVKWVRGKIKSEDRNAIPNGILYLKGGDLSEELKPFPSADIIDLTSFFEEPFFETKKVVYLII